LRERCSSAAADNGLTQRRRLAVRLVASIRYSQHTTDCGGGGGGDGGDDVGGRGGREGARSGLQWLTRVLGARARNAVN